MEIYNKYRAVPAEALRAFDNGRFKGTDINTMWRIKSLTEMFGPCGVGWYYTIKKLWIEKTEINEQFAFAEIELFIKVDGEWSMPISGNGGNKMTSVTKNGEFRTSDEAFKMAVTDAFGVACRNLGLGADVYWDKDTTKYTSEQRENKITEDVLDKAAEWDIQLDNLAVYYKKPMSELTNQDVLDAIEMKRQAYAQKGIKR